MGMEHGMVKVGGSVHVRVIPARNTLDLVLPDLAALHHQIVTADSLTEVSCVKGTLCSERQHGHYVHQPEGVPRGP